MWAPGTEGTVAKAGEADARGVVAHRAFAALLGARPWCGIELGVLLPIPV